MKNILRMLIAVAMALTPQISFARQDKSQAHLEGMAATREHALDDLRRIMNCWRDSIVSCTPKPYINFYDVSIETKGSQIYTVEAKIQYNDGTNSLFVDRKSMPRAKNMAAQLVHYFVPKWKDSARWTNSAIERGLKLCAITTRHNGVTVLIYPFHPVNISGHFLELIITRSKSIETFNYDHEDCLVRSDNP